MASFASAAAGGEEYDMFVILNFHGNISKIPIISTVVKYDVVQMSSELDGYGFVQKGTIFDIIIENVNGSKKAIDSVKQQIRNIETEEFAEMVEKETFSKELEKVKTIFLNNETDFSIPHCEEIMKNLKSKFLVDTPEIKEKILLKIKKICNAISRRQNPSQKTISTRSDKAYKASKTSTVSKASTASKEIPNETIKTVVESQFEDLKNLFIEINSNHADGTVLRYRTYKNCFPAWDFEGRHETDETNYRGILIGAYDGSALDVCFKDIIASSEFATLINMDPEEKLDPNYLKNKNNCILRKGTLIYVILYFLGQNCFYIDEDADEDIDEDIDESPRKEKYFELLEEMSRNYDELPSDIEGGIPYQTKMISINAFIMMVKILTIRYNQKELTDWYECITFLDGGAMKAHFYGFTCSKLHNITIETQCGLVRILTGPRGGSKTRRKKPRNKHSRKSRKRRNSLILKVKRKPRK